MEMAYGKKQAAEAAKKPKKKVPVNTMGHITVEGAATELVRLCEATSVVDKLEGFSKCKAVLTAALRSPAIFPVLAGDHGADAYMPLLSFAILKANPNHLLSHLQFVRLLHPDSLSVKDFVDACVAIKALLHLDSTTQAETPPPTPPPPPADRPLPKRPDQVPDEDIRSKLGSAVVAMGYPADSVEFGIDSLSPEDLADATRAQAKLVSFLSDLRHLRGMGFPKNKAMLALIRCKDLNTAVQQLSGES
mmetsp:Transcript_19148/g.36942  ORF Transcript_19148/g.36942 Transcript_19148/m.36942 type:complete len:248 (+) Transcript_19148:62-805(+)